jgi:hypothetical protein
MTFKDRYNRWASKRIRWHQRRLHELRETTEVFLPITICLDCDMSWTPVWGTDDTIVSRHPKMSDEDKAELRRRLAARDARDAEAGRWPR